MYKFAALYKCAMISRRFTNGTLSVIV